MGIEGEEVEIEGEEIEAAEAVGEGREIEVGEGARRRLEKRERSCKLDARMERFF